MTATQIPTTIITGFLGAGKTTIITNLIDELQQSGVKVAYIKNEIGAVDIDTKIFKGKDIKTTELLNGCICCTLVGPFASAVDELVATFSPTRIIIEASGAADPAALALMVSSHPKLFRDGVISIIDVTQFEGFLDLSITAQRQTQFTDLIIFNKVEQADLERKKIVVGYVRELNAHSPIIEAVGGKVSSKLLFGLSPTTVDALLTELNKLEDETIHDHVHEDEFESFSISTEKSYSPETILQFFQEIPKNIFRTKGLFKTADSKWFIQNGVGGKVTTDPIDQELTETKSTFVFIGKHCEDQKATIQKSLLEIALLLLISISIAGCTQKKYEPLIGRSQTDDPNVHIIDDATNN